MYSDHISCRFLPRPLVAAIKPDAVKAVRSKTLEHASKDHFPPATTAAIMLKCIPKPDIGVRLFSLAGADAAQAVSWSDCLSVNTDGLASDLRS